MARRPALFRGWLRFAARLMPRGRLPRRDTELVILRVAHLRDCDYEFRAPRAPGPRAGVTARDVERVQVGSSAAVGPTASARCCARPSNCTTSADLDDATWAALREHLSEADAVEFCCWSGTTRCSRRSC